MRVAAFVGALIILSCINTSAGIEARSTSNRPPGSAQTEIRNVMAERVRASLAGDTDAISRSMANDYIQTDISGYAQDKATWLREYFVPLASLIKSGKFTWEQFEQCDLTFRVHGNVAVVMGRLEAKGTGAKWSPQLHTWVADPTSNFGRSLFFTHVYRQEGSRWLLAALQNAVPVGPQPTVRKCN